MAFKKEAMNDDTLDQVTGGTKLPYAVQPNDSLQTIADKFHCSVDQLRRWNKLGPDDKVQVNQTLFIKF